MKKTLRNASLFLLLGSITITQTGCFGSFALTKKAYAFHDGITDSKFLKSLLFWIPGCIVYPIVVGVDTIILNLIEFWSGSNPISMNEGDHELQLVTLKGIDYRIDATKDTFTTTQLTGADAGAVRILKFDRTNRSWNYSDALVCDQPILTFLDDQAQAVRIHTTNGPVDLTAADAQDQAAVLAKFRAVEEGMACVK
ncbi:MAG: DUF3332 family protein [Flavobacteriales bacterium]|nr:DUF3332 family protein [Flavobacteriales bacterium]MBL0035179.1 DUF3332 family protein [Flavobacteriales bacterium]